MKYIDWTLKLLLSRYVILFCLFNRKLVWNNFKEDKKSKEIKTLFIDPSWEWWWSWPLTCSYFFSHLLLLFRFVLVTNSKAWNDFVSSSSSSSSSWPFLNMLHLLGFLQSLSPTGMMLQQVLVGLSLRTSGVSSGISLLCFLINRAKS